MGNSVVLSAGQEAVVRMATCHKTLTVSIVNLAKSVPTTALALNGIARKGVKRARTNGKQVTTKLALRISLCLFALSCKYTCYKQPGDNKTIKSPNRTWIRIQVPLVIFFELSSAAWVAFFSLGI